MIEFNKTPKEDFYYVYKSTCEAHGFPAMHIDNIEEVFICKREGLLMYSCLKWNTGSAMCMIGFPISNLYAPKELREGLLPKFFNYISEVAKSEGYNIVWTTSATERVERALSETDFQKGDETANTYIKVLS